MFDSSQAIGQIDGVLARWRALKTQARFDDFSDLPVEERNELVALMLAAIERLAPDGSTYRAGSKTLPSNPQMDGYSPLALNYLAGILQALRADYEAGYLQSITELVHAGVFADFLRWL